MNAPDLDWHNLAICARIEDVSAWFPGKGEITDDTLAAIETCGRCPVRGRCLELALTTETPATRHGIWGGTTPAQRQAIANGKKPRQPGQCHRGHSLDDAYIDHRGSRKCRTCTYERNRARPSRAKTKENA